MKARMLLVWALVGGALLPGSARGDEDERGVPQLPARPEEERAQEVWLARGLGVAGAEAAVVALDEAARHVPTGENWVEVSRACYWLGLMRGEAKTATEDQKRAFARGAETARAAQKAAPDLAGGYYWEAVNRSKLAELRGIVASAGELPSLQRLLNKTESLDKTYWRGAIPRFRAVVITRTPEWLVRLKGGSLKQAEDEFRTSLQQGPEFCATKVFWAELKIKQDDKEGARGLLQEVLAAAPAADPDTRSWNLYEKVLAKRLLDALDE